MAVRRPRLQHTDGMNAACRQPGGKHGPGRAGADDHIVETVCHERRTIKKPHRRAMSRTRDNAAYRTSAGNIDKQA